MSVSSPSDLDALLFKLDAGGNVTWQRTYHAGASAYYSAVESAPDGGYVMTGGIDSLPLGGFDAWLVKVNETGNIVWQRTYGGDYFDDTANSVSSDSRRRLRGCWSKRIRSVLPARGFSNSTQTETCRVRRHDLRLPLPVRVMQ